MVPKEMQWCDDRNESRTASCQHQTLFNVNITANFVGHNTEFCNKRVCELEEKQWRTDRNESGSESMTEYVAPLLSILLHQLHLEFVTPSPVIEYSAPAPSVICLRPVRSSPTQNCAKNMSASLRRNSGALIGMSPGQSQ